MEGREREMAKETVRERESNQRREIMKIQIYGDMERIKTTYY